MMRVLTILLTYLLLASAVPVCAQQDLPNQASSLSPSEEPEQLKPKEGAETFVWDHAIKGKEVDLNDFCRSERLEGQQVAALHVGEEVTEDHEAEEVTEDHEAEEDPDPRVNDDRWKYPCRTIRAAFIKDILTKKSLRDKLALPALRISGASIAGALDLTVAHIVHEVWLNQSRFEEEVKLTSAQFDRGISFQGSTFEHGIDAERLQVKGALNFKGATVRDEAVKLWMAKIDSNLDMGAAVFEYGIAAYELHVGGNLYLGSEATVGGGLFLGGATIDGDLDMSTSTFKDVVLARIIHEGGRRIRKRWV
jgi:hypothetical protein